MSDVAAYHAFVCALLPVQGGIYEYFIIMNDVAAFMYLCMRCFQCREVYMNISLL